MLVGWTAAMAVMGLVFGAISPTLRRLRLRRASATCSSESAVRARSRHPPRRGDLGDGARGHLLRGRRRGPRRPATSTRAARSRSWRRRPPDRRRSWATADRGARRRHLAVVGRGSDARPRRRRQHRPLASACWSRRRSPRPPPCGWSVTARRACASRCAAMGAVRLGAGGPLRHARSDRRAARACRSGCVDLSPYSHAARMPLADFEIGTALVLVPSRPSPWPRPGRATGRVTSASATREARSAFDGRISELTQLLNPFEVGSGRRRGSDLCTR